MDFVLFQIRYTGYRDRTHDERIVRFQSECREGRCPVVSKLFIVTLLVILLILISQEIVDRKFVV